MKWLLHNQSTLYLAILNLNTGRHTRTVKLPDIFKCHPTWAVGTCSYSSSSAWCYTQYNSYPEPFSRTYKAIELPTTLHINSHFLIAIRVTYCRLFSASSASSHSSPSSFLCDFPLAITINVTIRLIFILKPRQQFRARRKSVSCYGCRGRRRMGNTHTVVLFSGKDCPPKPQFSP